MIKPLIREHSFLIFDLNQRVYAINEYPIGRAWTLQQIEDSFFEGEFGWGYWIDNSLVAYCILKDLGNAWEIEVLATDPAHRAKGIMQSLFEFVLKELPEPMQIWLEVHERNLPAQRFYERNGFKRQGIRPAYYFDGGAAFLYSRDFKK